MIQLTRDLTAVAVRFRPPSRRRDNRPLFRDGLAGNPNPNAKVWGAAKDQLRAESERKCAYCEAPTATVAHGDVEHFRPKVIYWWWAYCYFNYTYACQICNQSNKGTQFPLRAETARIQAPVAPAAISNATLDTLMDGLVPNPFDGTASATLASFRAAIKAENALLVDPYEEDPEPFFKYIAKPGTREVEIASATASGVKARRAKKTIEILDLNREELVGHRFKIYEPLELARRTLASADASLHAPAQAVLQASMRKDSDHAGMMRYFIRREWGLGL